MFSALCCIQQYLAASSNGPSLKFKTLELPSMSTIVLLKDQNKPNTRKITEHLTKTRSRKLVKKSVKTL